jgi:DNA-binding winged helix-turn-helix (wHTH) protein
MTSQIRLIPFDPESLTASPEISRGISSPVPPWRRPGSGQATCSQLKSPQVKSPQVWPLAPIEIRSRIDVDPMELADRVARLEMLLRQRQIDMRETMLRVGPLELDLIEHNAARSGRMIELLPQEFRLLRYMMRHPDRLLGCDTLLEDVWNYKFIPKNSNLVHVHMGRLHHKIDGPDEARMIHNVRGAGFILRTPD